MWLDCMRSGQELGPLVQRLVCGTLLFQDSFFRASNCDPHILDSPIFGGSPPKRKPSISDPADEEEVGRYLAVTVFAQSPAGEPSRGPSARRRKRFRVGRGTRGFREIWVTKDGTHTLKILKYAEHLLVS